MILKSRIAKFQKILFLPLIILHLVLLTNTSFTLWPEMMVYPYLFNNGFILYKDLANPYPPTLTLLLSQITKFFGNSPQVFLNITWIFIVVIDLLVYFVSKKIYNNQLYANLSLFFFAIFSIPFLINGLWFDLVQTPLIILAIYHFIKFIEKNQGEDLQRALFFLGLATLVKQQAIWLGLVFAVFLIAYKKINKRSFRLILRPASYFLSVIVVFSIYLYSKGALLDFINWTLVFPFVKAAQQPGYILLPSIKQISVLLILTILCMPALKAKNKTQITLFASSLTLFIFGFPRFDYFHIIPSLAVFSLVFPAAVSFAKDSKVVSKFILFLAFTYLTVFAVHFYQKNWTHQIRFLEPEVLQVSAFLSQVTSPTDKIYIQNGPDQILPLSRRLPPKPWYDEFPWYLEQNNNQEKVILGLEKDMPKFVLYYPYNNGSTFDLGSYRPKKIADYLDKNYKTYFKVAGNLWLKVAL